MDPGLREYHAESDPSGDQGFGYRPIRSQALRMLRGKDLTPDVDGEAVLR